MRQRIDRSRIAGRLAAVLLATTCLTPLLPAVTSRPALADGGNGGGGGGGTGGPDSSTGAGGAGTPGGAFTDGGGGGGAGETGGNGGQSGGGAPVAGGQGATGAGGDGQGGGNAATFAAGGGGGGAHGQVTSTLSNGGLLKGGNGGGGGAGHNIAGVGGGGGGGGGGGYGAVVTGAGASSNGGSLTGGTGGAGGTAAGGGGGTGGTGGTGLQFTTGAAFTNAASGSITGGVGGAGGADNIGVGGIGGNGGAGIVNSSGSPLTVTNTGTITGGTGGNGGVGPGFGGNPGIGGVGISFGPAGGSLINSGTIAGGASGNPGSGPGGIGGVGIVGAGVTIINRGTINGGLGGAGALSNAITFTGGTNVLELQAGASFRGAVVAFSSADTFRLGGSVDSTFDVAALVVPGFPGEFAGFGVFEKTGSSTSTLINNPNTFTPWTITQGTLAISLDGSLGTSNELLTFNGGTLQATSSFNLLRPITITVAGGTIDTQANTVGVGQTIDGPGGLTKIGSGTLRFSAPMTYSGGTTVNAGVLELISGSSLNSAGALTVNGGTFDMSQLGANQTVGALSGAGGIIALGNNTLITNSASNTMLASQITDGGIGGGTGASLIKQGSGILALTGANTYTGGTTISGGLINFMAASNFGTGAITLNGGGLQWATGNTLDISSRLAPLGAGGGTFDTNGNNVTLASAISGSGALTKQGLGTLSLTANNTYSGGTTVTGGLINFNAASNFGSGLITLNGGGLQWAAGSSADISAKLMPLGAGGGTFDTNGNSITFATGLSGTGGLAKQGLGTLNLTANNTYTGGTAVMAGTLSVNGSVAGNVAVGSAGTLGGNGMIFGNVVNAGTLAPGNSIGLLTVSGSYTQMAGSTYQVEANAAGQADRINVGGAAAIQGGTVQVLAQPGSYGPSTTYTIVRATGGVSGAYAGVTSNFAFLTPTLSYDANDVFLTLALPSQNAFTPTFLALTPNQKAVGVALNQSFANASGDFATVIGSLAGLNIQQGPLALNTISGEPYADFGTMNTNNSMMFMNALGQQMAGFHGGLPAGQQVALAQACEIEACDAVGPLSAWASALGGLGSVLGDGNASTLTYNFGGAAAGIDYRFDPRFLAGIGVGYSHGTQWVNSFMGQGWSDSVSVAAYGSFTQSGFYLDTLVGYAYFNNQLQRQILIPGLQQRTATGSTGANQFLGQIEGGYKVGIYAPAAATITPFGRFQISSVTQNAFSESGAQSLSLNVAQQTTNSQRTTIGADLGSSIGLGNERKLDLAVRLGWMHEFADVARPITAAFAGAPGNSFTVFGATPLRNAAVVGLQATTTIAAATQIYLRYDGEIATGTDNHALNVGVRLSW